MHEDGSRYDDKRFQMEASDDIVEQFHPHKSYQKPWQIDGFDSRQKLAGGVKEEMPAELDGDVEEKDGREQLLGAADERAERIRAIEDATYHEESAHEERLVGPHGDVDAGEEVPTGNGAAKMHPTLVAQMAPKHTHNKESLAHVVGANALFYFRIICLHKRIVIYIIVVEKWLIL